MEVIIFGIMIYGLIALVRKMNNTCPKCGTHLKPYSNNPRQDYCPKCDVKRLQ